MNDAMRIDPASTEQILTSQISLLAQLDHTACASLASIQQFVVLARCRCRIIAENNAAQLGLPRKSAAAGGRARHSARISGTPMPLSATKSSS